MTRRSRELWALWIERRARNSTDARLEETDRQLDYVSHDLDLLVAEARDKAIAKAAYIHGGKVVRDEAMASGHIVVVSNGDVEYTYAIIRVWMLERGEAK